MYIFNYCKRFDNVAFLVVKFLYALRLNHCGDYRYLCGAVARSCTFLGRFPWKISHYRLPPVRWVPPDPLQLRISLRCEYVPFWRGVRQFRRWWPFGWSSFVTMARKLSGWCEASRFSNTLLLSNGHYPSVKYALYGAYLVRQQVDWNCYFIVGSIEGRNVVGCFWTEKLQSMVRGLFSCFHFS